MKRTFLALAALAMFSKASVANDLPIMFYSMFEDEINLLDSLKTQPHLTQLDKEVYGSPIRLIVTYHTEATAGGAAAGMTSAILAGGTLGLLPVVTNNDLVVTYELRSHGQTLANYQYRKNVTDAVNIWAAQGRPAFDKKTSAWIEQTAAQFGQDVAKSEELSKLEQEHAFYFANAVKAKTL